MKLRSDRHEDWARSEPLSRTVLALFAVFLAVVASILVVTLLGLEVLSGLRAYAAGEGLYAKAQKEAVQRLFAYAESGDPGDWRAYREQIAVPMADARARRLLEQQPPDTEGARRALVAGRNHADDVGTMVALYRAADWLPEMREALSIWGEADAQVERLDALAQELRDALRGGAGPTQVEAILSRVAAIDDRLTTLESEFFSALGTGARRTRRLVVGATSLAGLAALVLGVVASARLLRRLRRRDLRFRRILERSHDVITILRTDGTVIYNSPALERVLGWQPGEVVGRSAFDLIHPEDRAEAAQQFLALTAEPERAHAAEFRFRHKDGRWVRMASTAGGLGDGTPDGELVVSSRDITGRRELEEQLLQAQKLESGGRLAGGVAHDFNNLLTAILGSAELAREDLPPDSPAQETLGEIQAAAQRAGELTRQLLAFARRQVIAPRVFDLVGVVRGLESVLRRLVGEQCRLEILAPEEPMWVRSDPGQIEQVIVNLAVNARDAMPEGGTIAIEVAPRDAPPRPGAPVVPCVELALRDTGVSIPDEIRGYIFEPFFTTKEQGRGTGLGLATCYGIVQQAGGTIEVESHAGHGTTFRVRLPRVEPEAETEAGEAEPQPAARESDQTVLLVEDDPAVRRVAARGLRDRGYRVLEAEDGPQALAAASREPGPLHVLVTDVVMPGMSGVEVADRLRSVREHLRVLYVSGHTEDAWVRERLGASDFLMKPFTPGVLADRVHALLAG